MSHGVVNTNSEALLNNFADFEKDGGLGCGVMGITGYSRILLTKYGKNVIIRVKTEENNQICAKSADVEKNA